MIKSTINLLQPELKPEKPLVTLKNVVTLWALTFVVMGALAFYTEIQRQSYLEQVTELTRDNTKLINQSEQLQQRLANHKPSPELIAELATLRALSTDKRKLFEQLTNSEKSYITGFASAMRELSELHRSDISLQQISIQEGAILFSGQARNAGAVPLWLNQFEQSSVLSGKAFQQMEMKELDDSPFIEFTVRSSGNALSGIVESAMTKSGLSVNTNASSSKADSTGDESHSEAN